MKKTILAAMLVLLAAGCSGQNTAGNPAGENNLAAQQNSASAPQQVQNPNIPPSITATPQNSANSSLNADLKNIDGQMGGLSADSASADQSLNQQAQ